MTERVREPIQTYLTPAERADLDRIAAALGVSRSEVLRRGIQALANAGSGNALQDLVAEGLVTAPGRLSGRPPPALPVAPLEKLLDELEEDRRDR